MMAACISFDVVTSKGGVLDEYKSTACFGSIWRKKFGDWGVQYYPIINTQPSEAVEFLRDMKEVGFQIGDPAGIVLDQRYYIPTYESPFGSPSPRAWFFGNLTLVRYLDEFTQVIYEYLALKQLMPDANKFELLQLAHFTSISGQKGTWYGNGHALIDRTFGEYPERYRSWEGVKVRCEKQQPDVVQNLFSGRSGVGAYPNARAALRNPEEVLRLHASAVNNGDEQAKNLRSEPAVVSGPVLGPVPADGQAARG